MKHIVTAMVLSAGLASPVAASELENLSDAERNAFRNEVRAYLLENPEVLMEAIAVLEKRQSEAESANDAALLHVNAEELFNDAHSYVGGNPDGDVVMVEFLDYRCGYCKKAHPEVVELLKSDGNIKYIVKEFPILGDESVLASRFAISVLQNADSAAYSRANDALMTFRGKISIASLEKLAARLGLDAKTIIDGMDAPAVDDVINKNHALGQRLRISGTPSFIMGDQMLRGYVPLDAMEEIVAGLRG